MRERANALGGTVEAGRDGEGVFTVRARLPVPDPVPGQVVDPRRPPEADE
jgi:hypothetical protein